MEEFRRKMAQLKESEYPEMLRGITAFVLINASAKKEIRLVDKLFKLEEVREVHSVHGSVDVIAKIVLKRDLVSSDAETIGDAQQDKANIRRYQHPDLNPRLLQTKEDSLKLNRILLEAIQAI
jgi:hypothetical protein